MDQFLPRRNLSDSTFRPPASAPVTAGAMTGQQALTALADARALEAALQGLRSRGLQLLTRLDRALTEADWAGKEALRRIDEIAATSPSEFGHVRPSDEAWKTILKVSQQLADLEVDAGRVLDRPQAPSRNGVPDD